MVDVLHFLFEDDINRLTTAEQAEAIDGTRKLIYETLYGTEYKYASAKKTTDFSELDPPFEDEDSIPMPLDPAAQSRSVKPFTPATKFNPESANPYNGVLDAPLG